MKFSKAAFCTYTDITPFPVQMGDKSTALVVGRGDVLIPLSTEHTTKTCKLKNVLHVPSLAFSLVSVSTLALRGLKAQFNSISVSIFKNDVIVASGTRSGGLYRLNSDPSDNTAIACVASL
eukprot:IDg12570t1